jgi:hypothetical protein
MKSSLEFRTSLLSGKTLNSINTRGQGSGSSDTYNCLLLSVREFCYVLVSGTAGYDEAVS